jgi:hypothetical protein
MADRMSALRSDALHRAGDAMLAGKGDAYVSHHKGVDSAL